MMVTSLTSYYSSLKSKIFSNIFYLFLRLNNSNRILHLPFSHLDKASEINKHRLSRGEDVANTLTVVFFIYTSWMTPYS